MPTYHYDAFNRMDSAGRVSYYVNPEGQRLRKTGAAGTTFFATDASGPLLAERPNGNWVDYVWSNGRLIGRVANGQIYAIHDDQVGRPEAVTDANRNVVWQAQNLAFAQNVTVATIALNVGFPGQYYDAETGKWNNGFRDYDSGTGRYLQRDPIGLMGGINTYAYGSHNPIQRIDPMGLDDSFCMRDASMCGIGSPGTPDYIHLSIGMYIVTFSLTYTKNGTLFAGWGAVHSNPKSLVSGKFGASLTSGKMIGCPKTGDQVDKWVTGISTGVSGFYGVGGGYSMNAAGAAIEGGIGTPSIGLQAIEDMTPVWSTGLGW